MRYLISTLLHFTFSALPLLAPAQDMAIYNGQWQSTAELEETMNLDLKVKVKADRTGLVVVRSNTDSKTFTMQIDRDQRFRVELDSNIFYQGYLDKQSNTLRGFMHSGIWQYQLTLKRKGKNTYRGTWCPLLAKRTPSVFYLSIENGKADSYEAYGFISDVRFPGFGCGNFRKNGDSIYFEDLRTGLNFKGHLGEYKIALDMGIAGITLRRLELQRSVSEWKLKPDFTPGKSSQTKKYAKLREMADSIHAGKITNTHSVLIAKRGKLIYEQYFGGFDRFTPHDTRSASKSISSAIIGIAIDQQILKDTAEKLARILPKSEQHYFSSDRLKQQISVGNLLTMSSGIDAIDFGIQRHSPASEDSYQSSSDWLKSILEAPMIYTPGTHANYSSANPHLLGVALKQRLREPMDVYIDRSLFAPLTIDGYLLQNDDKGEPYFGGGMYLTSRDLLKFGLLYANGGKWRNRQVISKSWVQASFGKYLKLENHQQKNDYGFLWWHHSYLVRGRRVKTVEARGAGGQYIFIIPEEQLVVVVTSGNFRNGRVWQPEKILSDYILTALL